MNHTLRNTASFLALIVLLIVSLYSISDATSNSASFGKYYLWLIFFNAVGLISLLGLIIHNVYRLMVQYRLKTIGSHLTARMIGVFVILTIIPVSIVYYFSLSFLHRSIDSWFDVGIETALESSLQLGRSTIDLRKREALNKTRNIATGVSEINDSILLVYLDDALIQHNANELTLVDHNQSIIASSSIDSTQLPTALSMTDVGELDTDNHYLKLVKDPVYGLAIRIVVLVQSLDATEQAKTLQALFPFTDRLNELTIGIQAVFDQYKQLAVLRNPLKTSFTLALSLIWLLSVLSAVWLAFVAARKLVSPISDLVEATKAVAAGDYEKQLTVSGTDELGFLLRSFNTMTRKIARSRMIAEQSQMMQALQKNYLESVMEHITSGVLTIDENGFIKRGNPAACSIFAIDSFYFTELYVRDVVREHPMMQRFFEVVEKHMKTHDRWQAEVIIFGHSSGRKILRVRGAMLQPKSNDRNEQVIVIDDLTQMIQAQKDSAWSEMARHLAHEIKNPLTPIQLSAERLQRKLSGEVSADKQVMLDRYTRTIVQQVEAMQSMVNTFTDYARASTQKPEAIDFNQMLDTISVLYQGNPAIRIELDLAENLSLILADDMRLRQLVHNLLKNSLEAIAGDGWIRLQTRCVHEQSRESIEFSVEDSGSGIVQEVADNLFDPYVTTKNSGSGLGLAIVQKIVDEHGGIVWVEQAVAGGARFIVRLPLSASSNPQLSKVMP